MHAFHQQIIVANDSTPFGCCASIDGYILTNLVVVTYLCGALFTLKLKVLRDSTNDGTWEEYVAVANTSTIKHGNTIHQSIVVANDNTFVNVTERTYLAVFADNGFWMNVG